jgi:predicted  nucleic acid-binding Zn-ribbon protein
MNTTIEGLRTEVQGIQRRRDLERRQHEQEIRDLQGTIARLEEDLAATRSVVDHWKTKANVCERRLNRERHKAAEQLAAMALKLGAQT